MVTSYTYDTSGRVLTTTDPDDRTTTLTYDSAGRPLTSTDNAGDITATSYDEVGRVLTVTDPLSHVTSYGYDDDGNRTSTTDANSHTSTAAYDVADQLVSSADARGMVTSYSYTPAGQLETVTDPDGRVTERSYDALGRVIASTDAGDNTTTFTYDARGLKTSTTLPSGSESSSAFDAAGQLVSSTDGNGNTTTLGYDDAGQLVTVTDPLARVSSTAYTADGKADTVTLADASTQVYAYNEAGQVVSFTDADGNITSYEYDDSGLLTSKTTPGDVTTSYSYDDAGRLRVTGLPDSTTVTNNYDDASRLVLQEFSASGATDIAFGYDAVGARTSMSDQSGSSSYSYNANGQLTAETNGTSQELGYSYTDSGLLASITYPGSRTVTYDYNAAGQLGSVTDWNNNTTSFGWTVDGRLVSQVAPNGVTQATTYDPTGQTTDISTTDATSTLADYSYGYDVAGQLVSDATTDPILSTATHSYTYDLLGQVTSSNDGTTSVGFGSTSAGQLGAIGDSTLTYDSAQRLVQATAPGSPTVSFGYDYNGSRTSKTVAGEDPDPDLTTTFSYDGAPNLASVTLPGDTTPTVTYVSNGDGLRQTRTQGGSTSDFLWSTAGGLPLLLDDGTNAYIYGASSTPIAQVSDADGDTAYLFGDLLGSVRLITDAAGSVTGTSEFDTYGNRTDHIGTTDTAIDYTGNWTDPTTGLVYLRARDYDPSTGQFMSVDPLQDQTRQPYAYVGNNPLLMVDPEGKRRCTSSNQPCIEDPSQSPEIELVMGWASGSLGANNYYGADSGLVQDLMTTQEVQDARAKLVVKLGAGVLNAQAEAGYAAGSPVAGGRFSDNFQRDFQTWLLWGNASTSDRLKAVLGTYDLTATVVSVNAECRTAEVNYAGFNPTTLGSALSWSNAARPMYDALARGSGVGTEADEYFGWTETVRY